MYQKKSKKGINFPEVVELHCLIQRIVFIKLILSLFIETFVSYCVHFSNCIFSLELKRISMKSKFLRFNIISAQSKYHNDQNIFYFFNVVFSFRIFSHTILANILQY